MVPGVDVRRGLGPSGLPGEGAGKSEDVVVRGTTRERRLGKTKLFAVAPIRHLDNSPRCGCVFTDNRCNAQILCGIDNITSGKS